MSISGKKRESVDPATPTAASASTPRRGQHYRKVIYVEGIKEQPGLPSASTHRWENLLEDLRHNSASSKQDEERVLPVALFGNPPLGHFMKVMHTGIKV
jgi:hypothetical protein